MKIALISPPLLKTPPTGYGGLEQVVYDLGCALVAGGDEVTLFAPPGSHIDGGTVFETIVAPERTDVNWVELEGNAYNKYASELSKFDIIHSHDWFGFPYIAKMGNPNLKICHTHHGHCDWNPAKKPANVKNVNLIAISEFMQKEYMARGWIAKYVYNGINLDKYPYSDKKSEHQTGYNRSASARANTS
jgi:glycosyltransferase involved in cell wall biosynthesis